MNKPPRTFRDHALSREGWDTVEKDGTFLMRYFMNAHVIQNFDAALHDLARILGFAISLICPFQRRHQIMAAAVWFGLSAIVLSGSAASESGIGVPVMGPPVSAMRPPARVSVGKGDPEAFANHAVQGAAEKSSGKTFELAERIPEPPEGGWPWHPGMPPPAGPRLQPVESGSSPDDVEVAGGLLPMDMRTGNCILTGEVYDSGTIDSISGAIVDIPGLGRSAETDATGVFRIERLPAGTFVIEVSRIGFINVKMTVAISPDMPPNVSISMRPRPSGVDSGEHMLEEEMIIGDYQEDVGEDLFLDLDVTRTLSSGLGKEDFEKEGISDAAGAVGKISGANVVGGKYAVVRGLADRYVATLVNGALISSADPSRKAVQLDIFPTAAIRNIEIHKTYNPALPGDFGGGTIDIQTLSFPEERILSAKYKYGWNNMVGSHMYRHPMRDLGFFGDVNTPVAINRLWKGGGAPVYLSGDSDTAPAGGVPTSTEADEARDGWRYLEAAQRWLPVIDSPEPDQSFELTYGDTFDLGLAGRLGFIASFQRATEDRGNPFGSMFRILEEDRSWNQQSFTTSLDWSICLSGAWQPNENHTFSAMYFKKRIVADNIIHGQDAIQDKETLGWGQQVAPEVIRPLYGADALFTGEFWGIDTSIRETEVFQFGGKHKFSDSGPRFDWSLTRSNSAEDRPHSSQWTTGVFDFTATRQLTALGVAELDGIARRRGFENWASFRPSLVETVGEDRVKEFEAERLPVLDPSLGKIPTIAHSALGLNIKGFEQYGSRSSQSIQENSEEFSIGLTQPFYFGDDDEGRRFEIGLGARRQRKERSVRGTVYLLKFDTLGEEEQLASGADYAANPDLVTNLISGYTDGDPYYGNGLVQEIRNVDSDLTLDAAYLVASLNYDAWHIGGGMRRETEEKSYDIIPSPFSDIPVGSSFRRNSTRADTWIPAASGGISLFGDRFSIDAAWSRTVARPTFHEFLPVKTIDQGSGQTRWGNFGLKDSSIENFDLSFALRPVDDLTFRISLFNKRIDDPIVLISRRLPTDLITYVNGETGEISGAEFEFELVNLGPFSVGGNYTYIDATLLYDVVNGSIVDQLETRFPFQPEHIFNINLGYEHEEYGFGANLVFNFTGEYATILRSSVSGSDVVLNPQKSLDLIVHKNFSGEHFDWSIRAGVRNLLGSKLEYTFTGNPGHEGVVYETDYPGRSFWVELKAVF